MLGLGLVAALTVSGCASTSPGTAAEATAEATAGAGVGLRIMLGSSFVNGRFKRSSTCDDPLHDYSPELAFARKGGEGLLALTMVDVENDKVHWVQTGIPADADGIDEHSLISGAREWGNDLGEATYDGPCPPAGETHRYRLTLYALDAPIDLTTAKTPTDAVRELGRVARARSSVQASYTRVH